MERPRKAAAAVALGILLLSLVPMLSLAQYAVPMADDLGYGVPVYYALQNGQSLWAAIWDNILYTYQNWQGTYFSVVLFSLQPAVFGEEYYLWTTYIMVAITILPVFFTLWSMKTLPRWAVLVLGSVISLLSVQGLPSPGEGIYWWNGAAHYMVFWSLGVVGILLQLKHLALEKTPRPRRWLHLTLCCLTAFLLGGGNYCTALVYALASLAVVFLGAYLHRPKCAKDNLLVTFFAAGGLALSVAAPGNAVRQSLFEPMDPITAILRSFEDAITDITVWTDERMIAALLLASLLFALALRKNTNRRLTFPFPPLIVVGSFCAFAALYTPPLYAMGGVSADPMRIKNIIWLAYLFLMFGSAFYCTGWLSRRFKLFRRMSEDVLPRPLAALLPLLALWFLLCPNTFHNSSLAYQDLCGEALPTFLEELEQRKETLADKDREEPRFQPLSDCPKSFMKGRLLTWMPDVLLDGKPVEFPLYRACGGEVNYVSLTEMAELFPWADKLSPEDYTRIYPVGGMDCVPVREFIEGLGYTIDFIPKRDTMMITTGTTYNE